MAEQLSGAELDAKFFEVCWPGQVHVDRTGLRQLSKPPVSTDANACEAWAMRWAREQGLHIWIHFDSRGAWAELESPDEYGAVYADETGSDWKEAFVRACVAAGQERLKQSKGE